MKSFLGVDLTPHQRSVLITRPIRSTLIERILNPFPVMIPPHLQDQIDAQVADTQAQAVLSASEPPVKLMDTPEVDERVMNRDGYFVVIANFARTLERQRDEARELIRCRDVHIEGLTNDLLTTRDNLQALLKDSREEASMWRRHIKTCLAYPRGSEAQVRCLEEVGQDAEYYEKQAHESITGGKK